MTDARCLAATALGLSLVTATAASAGSGGAPVIDMEATGTSEMQQEAQSSDGMETDTSADKQTAEEASGAEDRPGRNSGTVDDQSMANLIRSSELEGAAVYTAGDGLSDWAGTEIYPAIGGDWSEIGEVEDLAISHDRALTGFLVETDDGLLELGDQTVLLHLADVKLVRDDDGFELVTRLSESQLDAMKEVTKTWY